MTSNLRVGNTQGVWCLTEAGFYRAVRQRNTNLIRDPKVCDAVARFQTWVFPEVIPAMVRAGQATESAISGTTWSWVDMAFEVRQRYGLDYSAPEIISGIRAGC